jgi:hypothetical protein
MTEDRWWNSEVGMRKSEKKNRGQMTEGGALGEAGCFGLIWSLFLLTLYLTPYTVCRAPYTICRAPFKS